MRYVLALGMLLCLSPLAGCAGLDALDAPVFPPDPTAYPKGSYEARKAMYEARMAKEQDKGLPSWWSDDQQSVPQRPSLVDAYIEGQYNRLRSGQPTNTYCYAGGGVIQCHSF